jgi:NADH:ubiquinone oxidoreductase subunit H
VAIFPRSFNLTDIVEFQDQTAYFVFYLPGVFILFLIAALAETNRHPFDLPEAESELVGGFNTEHNSSFFAFFFLSEYASVLLMVFLINHLFLGG